MKIYLKKVGVEYVNVGILDLPMPIYEDENGKLYRYDAHWEKKRFKKREEMERLLKLEKLLPESIKGEVVSENKIYNWIVVKDKKGKTYRFEKKF
jgi:hypothetical protein